MLKLNNVNQYYGESHTLWDVDLDMKKGECLCVMGRNGVGKTTLLKTIMGLLPVKGGSIEFNGKDFARQAAEERARAGIGYVPQGREIFPLLSVEENLETGLQARPDRSKKIPDRIYDLFPVLHEMRNRRGGDLSGGQQQQLAIARALVGRPDLLLLDEPSEGIQPSIVQELATILRRIVEQEKMTVIVVEQNLDLVRRLAHHVHFIENGLIKSRVAVDKIKKNPAIISRYLSV